MLKIRSCLGDEIDVGFAGEFPNLSLWCRDREYGYAEPYCTVTLSVPGALVGSDEAFVKDYSENAGIGAWLERNGIARPTGRLKSQGYVMLPVYKFDLEKVEKHRFVFG